MFTNDRSVRAGFSSKRTMRLPLISTMPKRSLALGSIAFTASVTSALLRRCWRIISP
jgi:hypothetical protein